MLKKDFTIEIIEKADLGEREAYAKVSSFGNIDAYRDSIVKGAYAKTIKERPKIPLLKFHNQLDLVGEVFEMEEKTDGLYVKLKFWDTELGKQMYYAIKSGVLNEFSIGYLVNEEKAGEVKGEEVNLLLDIDLREVSVVWKGADSHTEVLAAKEQKDKKQNNKTMDKKELETLIKTYTENLLKEKAESESALQIKADLDAAKKALADLAEKKEELETTLAEKTEKVTELTNEVSNLKKNYATPKAKETYEQKLVGENWERIQKIKEDNGSIKLELKTDQLTTTAGIAGAVNQGVESANNAELLDRNFPGLSLVTLKPYDPTVKSWTERIVRSPAATDMTRAEGAVHVERNPVSDEVTVTPKELGSKTRESIELLDRATGLAQAIQTLQADDHKSAIDLAVWTSFVTNFASEFTLTASDDYDLYRQLVAAYYGVRKNKGGVPSHFVVALDHWEALENSISDSDSRLLYNMIADMKVKGVNVVLVDEDYIDPADNIFYAGNFNASNVYAYGNSTNLTISTTDSDNEDRRLVTLFARTNVSGTVVKNKFRFLESGLFVPGT